MSQNATKKKHYLLAGGIAFIPPLLFSCVDIWANKQALSPQGSEDMLWYSFYFFISLLIILALTVISLIGLIFKTIRPVMILVVIFGGVYLFLSFGTIVISGRYISSVRRQAFLELTERSKPIVQAINSYEKTHGQPPESLQQLVPKYLVNMPKTEIGAYPEYCYENNTLEEINRWDGNPWVLYVPTSLGGLNWDMFIYLPLQNYPRSGYGGYIERIGDWGYVHE